jgi:hypothetical protein
MESGQLPGLRERLLRAIEKAFPDAHPPPEAELTMSSLARSRPFESVEILRFLRGKKWTELDRIEIETHSDWLVYLSPKAFGYYLPAWLTYSLDLDSAKYPADFVKGYLTNPAVDYLDVLSPLQRETIRAWYDWLRFAYREEYVPPTPDYLLPPSCAPEVQPSHRGPSFEVQIPRRNLRLFLVILSEEVEYNFSEADWDALDYASRNAERYDYPLEGKEKAEVWLSRTPEGDGSLIRVETSTDIQEKMMAVASALQHLDTDA